MKYEYDYPMFSLTVDAVVHDNEHFVAIRRRDEPYKGKLALPGGFVEINETSLDALARELMEEINININGLEKPIVDFIYLLDNPNRDPRNRVVSAVYTVNYGKLPSRIKAGDDAAEVVLLPCRNLYDAKIVPGDIAFDHIVPLTYCFPGLF